VRVLTAFETLVCDECKGVDFGFESARAPLRYTGVGKEIVHTLKYRGYTRVVERLAAPLMLEALDTQDRASTPSCRCRCTARGSGAGGSVRRSSWRGAPPARLKAPVSDTLQVVHGTWDQVKLSTAERRAIVSGAFRARGRVQGRVLLIAGVFTTGATMSS
jgi:competence protein ComFC